MTLEDLCSILIHYVYLWVKHKHQTFTSIYHSHNHIPEVMQGYSVKTEGSQPWCPLDLLEPTMTLFSFESMI